MNRLLFSIWLWGIVFTSALSQDQLGDSVNLETAFAWALEYSIDAKVAKRDYAIATYQYEFTKATLKPYIGIDATLPNLITTFQQTTQPNGSIEFQPVSQNFSSASLTASQTVAATGGTFFVNTDLQRFDDFENKFKRYNGSPLVIGFRQPLIGFNRAKWEKQLAPIRFKEAQQQLNLDLERVRNQTASLFLNALIAQLDVHISQQNQSNNQRLLDIAQERFELGKVSRNDFLHLELEMKRAQKDLSNAKNVYREQLVQLNMFLGNQTRDMNYQHPKQVSIPPAIEIDEEFAWRMLLEHRPELVTQDRWRLEVERDLERTKREFGPSISFTGAIGLTKGGEQLADVYQDPKQERSLQVNLSIPLVDWGRKKNQVKMQQESVTFAHAQSTQQKLDLQTQVQDRIATFEQLQQELHLATEVKELALERFDISNQSFLLGNLSITDLTIAIREKDQALREHQLTLVAYWQSYFDVRLMTLYDFEKQQRIHFSD